MLIDAFYFCYNAECHYAECHKAECGGTHFKTFDLKFNYPEQ
jgi:hypothetical protein